LKEQARRRTITDPSDERVLGHIGSATEAQVHASLLAAREAQHSWARTRRWNNRTLGESIHAHHAGYRESGIGGEDGKWGLLSYTQVKTAYHHYG
jgi:acyl-CoA reductase-like NAD-dependent aldehyde dehydrogenase